MIPLQTTAKGPVAIQLNNMALDTLIVLALLAAPSALAIPLDETHTMTKRSNPNSRNIGTGFTIAFCTVLLAVVFFYLGMRRERAKSWRLWRPAPYTTSTTNPLLPLPAQYNTAQYKHRRLKNSISSPLAVSSSAPVHQVPDPVEAGTEPSVRYLELPCKEVYEMGLPSPKRPLRATWLSLDRRPWWLGVNERGERASVRASVRESAVRASMVPVSGTRESCRAGVRCERAVSVPSPPPPAYPDAVYTGVFLNREKENEERGKGKGKERVAVVGERKSNRSSFMDWTGLEYAKRIYIGRKHSCRV
jgi:hypothetical protein